MSDYAVYNCTVRGARYVAKDKPCEDASASYSQDGIHIAIIADGHGDNTCFRSNVGSEIACKVMLEGMKAFAGVLREQNAEQKMLGRDNERLVDHLFKTILARWTSEVLHHLQENPPTEEEYEITGSSNAAIYRAGKGLPHIYGTTIIAMLVTDTYALVIHQGDGRCVVFHENGEIDQPVPWDPRCEGRNTASLCDDDVLEHWRYHIIDMSRDRIIGCYAMSDGIEDSFETMDETNAYIGMLTSEYINMGREAFLGDLPEHFSMLSRSGSQDDVSLGCILDQKAAAEYAVKYNLMYEYSLAKGQNRRANERLSSMQRKTDYLTSQLETARAHCEQSIRTHSEAQSILEKVRAALAAAVNDTQNREQQKADAEAALAAVQKDYDEYMALRAQFVEKAATTQKRMDELEEQIRFFVKPPVQEKAAEPPAEEVPVYTQPAEGYVGFEEDETPDEQVVETPDDTAETDEGGEEPEKPGYTSGTPDVTFDNF